MTGTVTYDAPTLTAIFTPDAPLAFVAGYTATLTTGVKDLAGNPLAADFAWSFTTQEQHPLLTVSAGSGNPAEFSASADAAGVAVLQLRLAASVEDTVLDSLTVAGSGTGNEAVDIKTVRLYLDSDADGQVDVGERELGSASFTENDGTVTFSGLGITIPVGTSIHLLVAYDLSVFTLAGASTVPASSPGVPPLWALLPAAVTLLGLLLLRLRGRRTGTGTLVSAGVLAVALLAASCVLQPVVDCTYTAVASSQQDIQARGSITGRAATVTGTFPISGPVVTVERLTGGL